MARYLGERRFDGDRLRYCRIATPRIPCIEGNGIVPGGIIGMRGGRHGGIDGAAVPKGPVKAVVVRRGRCGEKAICSISAIWVVLAEGHFYFRIDDNGTGTDRSCATRLGDIIEGSDIGSGTGIGMGGRRRSG